MAKQERKVKELLKSKFYKHRVSFLFVAILLGLGLSYSLITWQACSDIDSFWEAMEELLTERNWLIIAGLPVAFCLWLFRTKDRKDQIEKAEGQIQKAQENIQASLLSNGLILLNSAKKIDRAIGLVQLLQLRNKGRVYQDQIDIATPGIDLEKAYLVVTDLKGARLQGANLQKANLSGANLQNANLKDTDLRNADLYGTNLQDADLQRANLKGANVLGAKFNGAQRNKETRFPEGFDPQKHGMIEVDQNLSIDVLRPK